MPGAKIRWEYHTHSTDHDVSGHAQLAVYLYPKGETPKYRTYLALLGTGRRGPDGLPPLDIPPNSTEESEGFHVSKPPAPLVTSAPHMHLRSKAMSRDAISPDGTTQTLS